MCLGDRGKKKSNSRLLVPSEWKITAVELHGSEKKSQGQAHLHRCGAPGLHRQDRIQLKRITTSTGEPRGESQVEYSTVVSISPQLRLWASRGPERLSNVLKIRCTCWKYDWKNNVQREIDYLSAPTQDSRLGSLCSNPWPKSLIETRWGSPAGPKIYSPI
jgi:hypothetical protein